MTTTKSVQRSFAVLGLPKPVAAVITFAQNVVTRMTNNPAFTSPTPTLAVVAAAITALQTAESAALARTKGAATARNDRRAELVTLLQQLKGYVQATADADAENGAAIIQSSGLALKKETVHKPRVFGAAQGAVSGTVKLVTASVAHRASYDWEYSLDGGKTWVLTAGTLQAKTSIPGLPPATTVLFRVRATTKTGDGDWSQPVSLIVK